MPSEENNDSQGTFLFGNQEEEGNVQEPFIPPDSVDIFQIPSIVPM